jgi:glycosyltransferase involved in cell wall biosynthesis
MSPGRTVLNISPWASFWSMGKGKGTPMGYVSARAMHDAGLEVVYISPRRGERSMEKPFPGFRQLLFPCPNLPGYEGTRLRRFLRPLRLLCIRLFRYLDFTRRAYRLGRAEGLKTPPALMYSHGTISALSARLLARRFRVPSVLRLYGVTLHPLLGSRLKLAYAFEETVSVRFGFDRIVIADDGSCGDIVATSLGADSESVHLIRDGLDETVLDEHGASREAIRTELGYDPEAKIVLSVSRLAFPRNVDLIIRAMKVVLESDTDHVLVILGDGRQRPELERLATELGLEDTVRFEGAVPRDDVYRHMEMADVIVTASHVSNLCNATLEAMALGRPIVATDTACTRTVFRDGENGVIVPFGDPRALAEGIFRVTLDADLSSRIARGARAFAQKNFYDHGHRIGIERALIQELTGTR